MRISLSAGVRCALLAFVLATGVVGTGKTLPAQAQDDGAKTPTQLCEAAQPNITEPETRTYDAAEQVLEEGVDYYAIFCTEKGAIYVDLYEQFAPIAVNNFVFLANAGYYNNTTFHRVIADFMIQGGDPEGTGMGGPGYEFQNEGVPFLTFAGPGVLAMANAGADTNGSQFFITRAASPHLDGGYTIFGTVLEGQDVVLNVTDRDPDTATEPGDTLNTVLIVTDPTTVETTFVAPEPFTGDQTFEQVSTLLPADSGFNQLEQGTGLFTGSEEAVGQFDEAAQGAATTWYGLSGFAYEAGAVWQVAECPADPELFGIGFRLLDWGSAENASAAAQDASLTDLMTAQGYTLYETEETLSGPLFTRNTSAFCDKPGIQARYIFPEGRYILMVDIMVDENVESLDQLPLLIKTNFSDILEGLVGNIILDGMGK
ncbi:MAG: peptidylprolyl isomerase [Chloroflexi bacterium]|nr:peptidylprolyl isomerase [Chloroflexota bacterium]